MDQSSHPYGERMSRLAESFPALNRWEKIAGIRPWDPMLFASQIGKMSHGEQCAARFVLAVWTGGRKFAFARGIKPFDLFEAMGVWDREQVAAMVAWCKEPFWP